MKNLKKILLASLVAVLVFAGCMVATFADDEYTGTLEDLVVLVEKAEKASGTAKGTALAEVVKYLNETPVDPATEGYDGVIERISAVTVAAATADLAFANASTVDAAAAYTGIFKAKETLAMFEVAEDTVGFQEFKDKYDAALIKTGEALLAKIDANIIVTLKTAENQVAINKARRVLFGCELYGTELTYDLYDLYADLAALESDQDDAVKINLAALESSNSITDYDLPVYHTFNAQSTSVGFMDKSGKLPGEEWHFELKNTKNPLGILQEPNGNKYVYSGYAPTEQSDKNTYVQLSLAGYKPDNGYVIEFDLTTFDTLPSSGIKIEAGGFDMTDGRGFPPFYLVITGDGSLVMGDAPNASDQNKVTAMSKAIVPGQWLHVAIIFDNAEFTYTLVVEGQKLTTTSAKYKGAAFDLSKGVIRFGGSDTSGSIAFDNFVLYSGSNYRNPNKFEEMTDDEKFTFYSDYLVDESKGVNGKNDAYDRATELLEKYWIYTDEEAGTGDYTDYAKANPDIMTAVDNYLGFDYESLLAVAKLENLNQFIADVEQLDSLKRAPDTINKRSEALALIDAFVNKYGSLINTTLDANENGEADYTEYSKIVESVRTEITRDQNAELFIRHMQRFEMVTATSAMQRYYDRAHSLVMEGNVDVSLAVNPDHPDRESFPDFVAAYETYLSAADLIAAVVRKDNSAKIVTCISYISDYTTEEEWLENYDMINRYINLVKDCILGTDANGGLLYDDTYSGIIKAVEFFNEAYTFFYNYQQEMHISYITNILDLISSTEAYVEKMGMVSMIDRYVAENELNYADARVISLLNALEAARSELEVRREDYAKILIQNAVYFVNLVEEMRTSETYSQKAKLFDAASLLYFNIDITVDGAAEAVEIYDEYKVELTRVKESSVAFLDAITYYLACETPEDRYAALVECYYNAQYAEMSYKGVEEAMEIFQTEYDLYMEYVEAVNAEITVSAGHAVGSLRSNCGVTPVIAVIIKKIYGE